MAAPTNALASSARGRNAGRLMGVDGVMRSMADRLVNGSVDEVKPPKARAIDVFGEAILPAWASIRRDREATAWMDDVG